MTSLNMTSLDLCASVLADLNGFVDSEIPGQVRRRIAEHLETCASCTSEMRAILDVGDLLRASSLPEPAVDRRLSGLGDRVIGRVRAEERASWQRLVAQACDGWHWTIVGAGSVLGTFVTTSILSLILAFGPTPARDDSLSALMGNLASPPGYLFIEVSMVDDMQAIELLQVSNGQPAASRLVAALAVSPSTRRSEAELVDELASTVTRDGRVFSLAAMDQTTRKRTEALFTELTNMRRRQATVLERTLSVRGLRLVTSITAKS